MPTSKGKLRVAILYGGRSAEHEVSLLSARFVVASLDRDRFEPVLVGIEADAPVEQELARPALRLSNSVAAARAAHDLLGKSDHVLVGRDHASGREVENEVRRLSLADVHRPEAAAHG